MTDMMLGFEAAMVDRLRFLSSTPYYSCNHKLLQPLAYERTRSYFVFACVWPSFPTLLQVLHSMLIGIVRYFFM